MTPNDAYTPLSPVARALGLSLAFAIGVWLAFAWPLPRYVARGIPSSAANIEQPCARELIPGDHLQLEYFYWLFSDMLAGRTPFLYNLYEFNRGDDAARRSPGNYNIPFSLVYYVLHWGGNRALAWNLTVLVTLWMTLFLTWLLLRRYARREWIAALGAIVAIALPYRWHALLGGSPTGLAMVWAPLLLLGIERIVREGAWGGTAAAGAALALAYFNDLHLFVFGLLLAPAWTLLVLLDHETFGWRAWRDWGRLARRLLPLAALVGACAAHGMAMKAHLAGRPDLAGGRSAAEVALFSPQARGLLARHARGGGEIYIGLLIPALLALGWLVRLARTVARPRLHGRRFAFMTLLLVGMALLVALALGPNGPAHGRVFELARRGVPPLAFLRQTARACVLLPTLLAVAAVLAANAITWHADEAAARGKPAGRASRRRRYGPAALAGGLLLLAVADYSLQVHPTICLLPRSQDAYLAVAEDATREERVPRAIVISFWPGDSHWASVYQYNCSLYRIRMLNGYRPWVDQAYIDNAFLPYGTINLGLLSDAQLDGLLRQGIRYVLLHEDAFPEAVSPFPVGFTLKRLLEHPRLDLLRQDRGVWAFKIRPSPRPVTPVWADWQTFFPTHFWDVEWCANANCTATQDPDACGGLYLTLARPDATVDLRPFQCWNAPAPRLQLRARGRGDLRLSIAFTNGAAPAVTTARVDSADWTWVDAPFAAPADAGELHPRLDAPAGRVDVDIAFFLAGPWPTLEPGASVSWPASRCFHGGYTDLTNQSVRLRAEADPADVVVYGPKLPLAPGRYALAVELAAPGAAAGTVLGAVTVASPGWHAGPFPAVAGTGATTEAQGAFRARDNRPMWIDFRYARAVDVEVRRVTIQRLE